MTLKWPISCLIMEPTVMTEIEYAQQTSEREQEREKEGKREIEEERVSDKVLML